LGTDAETWQGTWRAALSLNDRKVREVAWEVTPPRDGALAEYQAYLAANPQSARAHYRVGAAAALAGQDALAESELKKAADISKTWWYPPLALGRLYHRQGKHELAREQFHFMKGLLLGRQPDPGSFIVYIQAMLDDHLKQLGP
jgi:Flp pilus assembly protein TadD